MAEPVAANSWVEIQAILFPPGQRAPQVPEDTAAVPLELRAKGFLLHPARPGDEVEILTMAGRKLRGTLARVNPPYEHGFGPPIAELTTIASELRRLLNRGETA